LKELAAYYPDLYWFLPEGKVGRLAEAYRRFVLRDHLRFVKQAVANSDRAGYVVDVGCGNGLLLSLLPYKKILGLDMSPKAISVAWRQNGVPGACADLVNAPLPRTSCSVVTMFHVLEHLIDPAGFLQAAREILTPGGRLVVQVPNASCWQFMLFGEKWNGLDVPRHLFNFRERDLHGLLDFCGFEVMRRKHFSLRDNPAGLATTVAPGLDPMARRVRQIKEGALKRFLKDGLYFAMVLLALPPTILGAACGAGSTIMIEARKKA
jgi:SAM-dependent methyltransferase